MIIGVGIEKRKKKKKGNKERNKQEREKAELDNTYGNTFPYLPQVQVKPNIFAPQLLMVTSLTYIMGYNIQYVPIPEVVGEVGIICSMFLSAILFLLVSV